MKKPNHAPTPLTQFIIGEEILQVESFDNRRQLTAYGWLDRVPTVTSAYIHIPFCFHKCHYCDFFSVIGKDDQHASFVNRLESELAYVGERMQPLETIFIGGGTPTLLSSKLFEQMLCAINSHLPMIEEVEWSIEANPETVTSEIATQIVDAGINRVSVGAQSFDTGLLNALERWHNPSCVDNAVEQLCIAGINNINIDLIYAIPNQTLEQVEQDLQHAIDLQPQHISCYALTYEPSTPLQTRLVRGEIERVEHELEAEMFKLVANKLRSNQYLQYEISNYALKGFECMHNLAYWKNKSWWPFGPAASGHLDGCRWKNSHRISDYVNTSDLPYIKDLELVDPDKRAGEEFMMGLRLIDGMERSWVEDLISKSINCWRRVVIDRFIDTGFLHWKDGNLALTEHGVLFTDTVVSSLLMHEDGMTDITGQ